jgi:SAM-dependent methyltransferase
MDPVMEISCEESGDGADRPLKLIPTDCAICGPGVSSTQVYDANFGVRDFNPEVYSARRLPDRVHYRMARCDRCGLLRSDPVADPDVIAGLYRASSLDYTAEFRNLRRTYGRHLRRLAPMLETRESLLEIGCGNGFFLEEALAQGYLDVRGIEPSEPACAMATPAVATRIVNDIVRPGQFESASFDVICLFQVLDHLPEPSETLREVLRLLRPGGVVLALNHNADAFSNRALGERSPIIDIEHTYLYDKRTGPELFRRQGFEVLRVDTVWNTYSLAYLVRLIPMPAKRTVVKSLQRSAFGRIRSTVPLGNMAIVARPAAAGVQP